MTDTSVPISLKSPQMQEIYRMVDQVASTKTSVLISGETGVGKEIVAHRIHHKSPRNGNPFRAINCSAFPDNGLLQSELFGHEKGAFTGATQQRYGLFEQADKGTLFLDEVGEMSIDVQAMLLRAIETQEITRLGGNKTINVDVRIITATNKCLTTAIKDKAFRKDLYYRLNGFPIHIPPLRERREDILDLVDAFIHEISVEHNRPISEISDEARDCLYKATLPGNIRQLRNAIDRAIIATKSDLITLGDLPADIGLVSQQQPQETSSDSKDHYTLPSSILYILSTLSVKEFILIFGAIPNSVWRKIPENSQRSIVREASFHLSQLLGGQRNAIKINGKDKNEILSEVAKIRMEDYGSAAKAAASLGIDRRTLQKYADIESTN